MTTALNFLFVTGMGRSGTSTVGRLLRPAPGAEAHHEKIGDREYWLLSWYLPAADYAVPYLTRVRRQIEESTSARCFVDVNAYLQNSVSALREVFPEAALCHLVRDGRKVVRSLYTRRSEKNVHLIPKDRKDIEWWFDADKFERICWNWADTTRRLAAEGVPLVRFEEITSDYGAFRRLLLEPAGLDVTEKSWRHIISERKNRTRSAAYRFLYAKVKGKEYVGDRLPAYEAWPEERKEAFWSICGAAMKEAGYSQ